MIRLVLSALMTLTVCFITSAQTITLGTLSSPLCTDMELMIPVTITGTFAPENTFRVQVKTLYGNQIASYPATLNADKLRVVLSNVPFAESDFSSGFQLRVLSSAPVVETGWTTSFGLNVPAVVTLSSVTTEPVNRYEDFEVRLAGRGSGGVTVTLNDSLELTTGSNLSGTYRFDAVKQLTTSRDMTFRLTRVRNLCGVGRGDGSVTVRVNPVSLRVTSLSNPVVCAGSVLYVAYATEGGSFQAGNQFKIRLTRVDQPTDVQNLDATLENGVLRTTVPGSLSSTPGLSVRYQVRIVATQPAVVSAPADSPLQVYPAPSARFSLDSRTINIGEFAFLGIQFGGIPPFSATLSDGSVLTTPYATSSNWVGVSPAQTTSYSIVSFASGCGSAAPDPGTVQIAVRPSVRIDSLPTGPLCEGSTQRVPFRTNVNLSASAQFRIRLVNSNDNLTTAEVPATAMGNTLSFSINTTNPASTSHFFKVQLTVTDGPISYSFTSIENIYVLRTPSVTITQPTPVSVPYQGYAFITASYAGGGPYTLTFNEGTVVRKENQGSSLYDNITFYPTTSGQYTLREVRNACFAGTGSGSVNITVTNVPALAITLIEPGRDGGFQCAGDSLPIRFLAQGNFAADNVFQVQVQQNNQGWQTIKTGLQPGSLTYVSHGAGYQSFRVVSTNPIVYSQERGVQAVFPPTASLSVGAEIRQPVAGETRQLQVSVIGGKGPYTAVFSDGVREFTRVSNDKNFSETVRMDKTTTYTLRSLRDGCRTGSVDKGSVTVAVLPVRIQLLLYDSNGNSPYFCTGSRITVPFSVEGQPTATTTYVLQMARADSAFVTIGQEVRQSPFILDLPNRAEGSYKVRVVARSPDVASESAVFGIRTPPTATLTTNDGSGQLLSEFGAVQLRINLTGSGNPYRVVFSDEFVGRYYAGPAYRELLPLRRQTYALRSVTGYCGYGTVTGQVVVGVKPTLTLQTAGRSCISQPLSMTYSSRGEFGPDNLFRIALLTTDGRFVTQLDSSRGTSGVVSLTLPATLSAGAYLIRLTATDPALTVSSSVQLSVPVRLILSGSTIINAGQATLLTIQAQNLNGTGLQFNEDVTFTLSTGQTQTRNWYGDDRAMLSVSPPQTTVYTLSAVSNACGAGQAVGSAVVTVNPVSANSIAVTQVGPFSGTTRVCMGDTLQLTYAVTGSLPTGTTLTAQLSDSTGLNFRDLTTVSRTATVVRALLPATLPRTYGYRIRIRASDSTVAGGAYANPLTIRARATVRFATPTLLYQAGMPVQAVVQLGGDGPWQYSIAADLASIDRFAQKSPDTVALQAASPVVVFRLSSVTSTWCGAGTIENPGTIRVELITAVEPGQVAIDVFPNPTAGLLRVRWPGSVMEAYDLRLISLTGETLLTRRSRQAEESLELAGLPTGIYLLRVEQGSRVQVFRIIKQ